MFSSKTDQWSTPQDLFDKLNEEFHFTLDPCADEYNHKCDKYYTESDDGLKQDWSGETVFVNPPYSDSKHWIEKCYKEARKNHTRSVMLIPARTDTVAFQKYILPYSGINSANPKYCYYAGLFDGEGCIRITEKDPKNNNPNTHLSFCLQTMLKMTDCDTVQSIQDYFNCGKIYIEHFETKKDTYRWECYNEDSERFLNLLYPYFKTKKSQAFLALEYQQYKHGCKKRDVSKEVINTKENYYNIMKDLKRNDTNIFVNTEIRFIKGRLKFGDSKNSAPFPSMIVIFN